MNKDVILHLHSAIVRPGEKPGDRETENIQFKTPATFLEKEQVQYLLYAEEDAESGAKTRCRLEIHERKIVMTRLGVTKNQMEFIIGESTTTQYQTPFGVLQFHITTDTLQVRQTANEYKVLVCYSLHADGSLVSKHTLQLRLQNA